MQPPQVLSFDGRVGLNPKPLETLRSSLRLNPSNVETQIKWYFQTKECTTDAISKFLKDQAQ
jgi:hypothetical protein